MASSTTRNSSSSSGTANIQCERGIPRSCVCGEASVMRTSRTSLNPGRLFHICPFKKEGDKYHLFKWSDESMMEEIEDMKEVMTELRECIGNNEIEINKIKDLSVRYEEEMGMLKRMVSGLENEVSKSIGELKNVKNMIVGVGVIFVIGVCYLVV